MRAISVAHGVAWRGLVMFGCSTLGSILSSNPALAPFASLPLCPPPPPKAARAKRGTPEQLLRSLEKAAPRGRKP